MAQGSDIVLVLSRVNPNCSIGVANPKLHFCSCYFATEGYETIYGTRLKSKLHPIFERNMRNRIFRDKISDNFLTLVSGWVLDQNGHPISKTRPKLRKTCSNRG